MPGQTGPARLESPVTGHACLLAGQASLTPGLLWMFFLCCCFICLLLIVRARAGVLIMEITGSDVVYMTNVRSPIANLLMLPSG
jgi:hypothetical protein